MGGTDGARQAKRALMWNPFARSDRQERMARIEQLEQKVSASRRKMYVNLFELDDMVKRSLALLEPKKLDDQSAP